MKFVAFTICSNNYLSQAVTLGQSLIRHNPNWKFVIGLVDKLALEVDYTILPFEVLPVEKLGITDFNAMFLRYDIIELNTAVKPYYFKWLFSHLEQNDCVAYFDPDIYIYNPLSELEHEWINDDILLTPHITSPIDNDGKKPAEEDILNTGLYNLGFIGVKNNEIGQSMVCWWADRLKTKAYIDFRKGYFTDQIWINLVPLYFDKVKILQNYGYNVAYWNLHERKLVVMDDDCYVMCKNVRYLLVFFHFSGYNPLQPEEISKYQNRRVLEHNTALGMLFDNYGKEVLANGLESYRAIECIYKQEKDRYNEIARINRLKSMPRWKRYLRVLLKKIIKSCNIEI